MKSYSDSYKAAGVDVTAGYKSVELMKEHVKRTSIPGVVSGIGGFGGLFQPDMTGMKEPVLVSGTDGVGTKLVAAMLLDKHDTIGIDCVAMCVNDVVCCGAKPLFFLDYIACGKNVPEKIAEIVKGVAEGCVQSGCALIGGETAEHPGVMPEDVELLHMASHVSRNTSSYHLNTFYKTFNDVKDQRFDGLIITGAPVEKMPFEEVDYWDEMCAIMEWSKTHVYSVLYICWGAQAGLYYHYGIQKHLMKEKLSGIYNHHVLNPYHPLMRGFDDNYFAPHSRYTEVYLDDIKKHDELIVLSLSDLAGVHIVAEKSGRKFFVTGHAEYDRDTLAKEYFRDINKGLNPKVPYNYFPDDDDQKTPPFTWRSNAHLLVANWLNYYVYQQTPYDLNHLEG